jgi:hypothetical protein
LRLAERFNQVNRDGRGIRGLAEEFSENRGLPASVGRLP